MTNIENISSLIAYIEGKTLYDMLSGKVKKDYLVKIEDNYRELFRHKGAINDIAYREGLLIGLKLAKEELSKENDKNEKSSKGNNRCYGGKGKFNSGRRY